MSNEAGANVEFLLDELQSTPDGLVLHGVVNEGSVRVGSSFVAVRRQIQLGAERGPAEPISVSVRRIVAYRHVLDELPRGMGGGLLVDVPNVDLAGGDMLFGPDESRAPDRPEQPSD